jgi:hypothetical protein
MKLIAILAAAVLVAGCTNRRHEQPWHARADRRVRRRTKDASVVCVHAGTGIVGQGDDHRVRERRQGGRHERQRFGRRRVQGHGEHLEQALSVVFVIVLWGLFIDGEAPTVHEIHPECGATHCQITIDEAKAIARLETFAVHAYDKAKRSCGARGSET